MKYNCMPIRWLFSKKLEISVGKDVEERTLA
jgi:hypothetical protein